MTSHENDDLESELLALGDLLDVPSPPPERAASAVRARLEAPDPAHDLARTRERRPVRRTRRWGLVAAIAVVVLSLTAAALVWVLRSTGVEIRVGEPVPTVTVTQTIPGERRMSLAEARTAVSFPLRVPAELGEPAEVTVSDGGRVVSMFWPGGIRFDQFPGGVEPTFLKRADVQPWPEQITINDGSGWWIQQTHSLSYVVTRDGTELPLRLADSTLVWGNSSTGYRLEGIRDRDRAVEVARSLR